MKSLIYVENFNTGFRSYLSDITLYLSQWQFWFWFWFSVFWILFFLVLYKISFYHNIKNTPALNSSLRSHGKWGDFIAAILPLTWCSGILINSNFILRTIEWQHENTLFTLRIHGRQWYWIFKYDLRDFLDMYSAKRKIGRQLLLKSSKNVTSQNYFKQLSPFYNFLYTSNVYAYWKQQDWEAIFFDVELFYLEMDAEEIISIRGPHKIKLYWNENYYIKFFSKKSKKSKTFFFNYFYKNNIIKYNNMIFKSFNVNSSFKKYNNIANLTRIWEVKRSLRKSLIKYRLSLSLKHYTDQFQLLYYTWYHFINLYTNVKIFKVRRLNNLMTRFALFSLEKRHNIKFSVIFNRNLFIKSYKGSYAGKKVLENRIYYILKLKRIKRFNSTSYFHVKPFLAKVRYIKYKNIVKFCTRDFKETLRVLKFNCGPRKKHIVGLIANFFLKDDDNNKSIKTILPKNNMFLLNKYNSKKKQFKKNILFSHSTNLRLLKVKRIALLPAATNITLITSSYDVAHSFFLPAVGLKFDCVPGRATHHTLNILYRGVYYAQCAEICGRYHHHMPARVGVVFFEQFLNWWKLKSWKIFMKINKPLIKYNFHIVNYYFTRLFNS